MFSSTTASASYCDVHRLRPFGGGEEARAISFASEAPSKMHGLAEGLEAFFHQLLASPGNRISAGIEGLGNPAVTLHPSPASEASAFNRMRALVSSRAQFLQEWRGGIRKDAGQERLSRALSPPYP